MITNASVVHCLIEAANSAIDQRRQARAEHPVAYLLNLRREPEPSDTITQIPTVMGRAATRADGGLGSTSVTTDDGWFPAPGLRPEPETSRPARVGADIAPP